MRKPFPAIVSSTPKFPHTDQLLEVASERPEKSATVTASLAPFKPKFQFSLFLRLTLLIYELGEG